MIETILSTLFPPKLPRLSALEILHSDRVVSEAEDGWAGNVRVKKYRDGIDRVQQEGI